MDSLYFFYKDQIACFLGTTSFTQKQKLEVCIVLNVARSSPLYATGVSMGPPESSMQIASRSFSCFCMAH